MCASSALNAPAGLLAFLRAAPASGRFGTTTSEMSLNAANCTTERRQLDEERVERQQTPPVVKTGAHQPCAFGSFAISTARVDGPVPAGSRPALSWTGERMASRKDSSGRTANAYDERAADLRSGRCVAG